MLLTPNPPLPGSKLPLVCLLLLALVACGGGGGGASTSAAPPVPTADVTVTISGAQGILNTGETRTFTAAVQNTGNTAVTWSVVESNGGAITQAGMYTAPSLPGTFTVKAVSVADPTASATFPVAVVIAVGHIPGYDVGVDYHAYGADFLHTNVIRLYSQPGVRDTVKSQLQGMADRGATFLHTRLWFVTEPGTTDFGEAWRLGFPITDQEAANLRAYVQDIAAVRGSGGNRLRLDICLLWLGAADYTRGTLDTGLGFSNLSPATFTSRVETTVDKVLAAVADIYRPDSVKVVDTLYLEGELMIGEKANQDWFMQTHYPAFVTKVKQAGLQPSVYFIAVDSQARFLSNDYVDPDYPILNNHCSQYWNYRSLKWMVDHGLPVPPRIDFSWYITDPPSASWDQIIARTLNDADAVLSTLGAAQKYGIAETHYFLDPAQRKSHGQAIAREAAQNTRLQRVSFWTAPDGGVPGQGQNVAYPFAIEDYYPPAP